LRGNRKVPLTIVTLASPRESACALAAFVSRHGLLSVSG
jgi:hypothetical protein